MLVHICLMDRQAYVNVVMVEIFVLFFKKGCFVFLSEKNRYRFDIYANIGKFDVC